MKKMIYYYPNPLSQNPNSGSSIRPLKMLNAFIELGYDVELISGYSSTRKKDIERVKRNIRAGVKYSFMYGENTSMPTALSDENHLPLHPILDLTFFKFLSQNNIPVGLFYRDIYWKFEVYRKQVKLHKRIPAKFFYHTELFVLNRYLTKFYLPSLKMLDYVPYIKQSIASALPPANDFLKNMPIRQISPPLKLLYVGGISDSYKMHELLKGVSKTENIELTICTREEDWHNTCHEYSKYLSDNISIVHKSGDQLQQLYLEHDISMMYFLADEYRKFAMPVKLFEYISREKPIIASEGMLVSTIVEDLDVGWVVEYDADKLHNFLTDLVQNNAEIYSKINNCKLIKPSNTWLARAKQVEGDLLNRENK